MHSIVYVTIGLLYISLGVWMWKHDDQKQERDGAKFEAQRETSVDE